MEYTKRARALLCVLRRDDPSYLPEEQDAIEQQALRTGSRVVTAQHLHDALVLTDPQLGRYRFEAAEQVLIRTVEALRRQQDSR